MSRVFMYVVGASQDPNRVRCVVPYWVEEMQCIFFGPCSKSIRRRLRDDFLGDATHRNMTPADEEIYIVGINAANGQQVRNIVWWGRVSELMTFAEAAVRLADEPFRGMREHPSSPLHVRPLFDNDVLTGYEHVSEEHRQNDEWVLDLVSKSDRVEVCSPERKLLLRPGAPPGVLNRDCCALLDNGFVAGRDRDQRGGIAFDNEAVEMLKQAQPDREKTVDSYAVFGRNRRGHLDGRRNNHLEIGGPLAEQFVNWLTAR